MLTLLPASFNGVAFEVEDDDLGALFGHHAGGREAQTIDAGAAGNDCDTIGEQHGVNPLATTMKTLFMVEASTQWRKR